MQRSLFYIIFRYESRIIRRSWLFRFLAAVSILGVAFLQFKDQSTLDGEYWNAIALSASIPFYNAALMNLALCLPALFVTLELLLPGKSTETKDALETHPIANATLFLGRVSAILGELVSIQLISIGIALFIHIFLSASAFRPGMYLFYFVTLILPSILVTIGITTLWIGLVKERIFATTLSLLSIFTLFYVTGDFSNGLFDPWGRDITCLFSDAAGHPAPTPYLLQRFAFLCAGSGLILISLRLYRRLSFCRERKQATTWASIIMLLAIISGSGYTYIAFRDWHIREEYRKSYAENLRWIKPRTVTHDIEWTPLGDTFSATSRMTLRNPGTAAMADMVMYLNPGLTIDSLRREGQPVPFRRDNQVIVVQLPLGPGEETNLEMAYRGNIDERICYLDIPDETYNNPRYPRIGLIDRAFRFGKRHAFLTSPVVLLHPEALWYPVTTLTADPLSGISYDRNFTRFHLSVPVQAGKQIISQGVRTIDKDRTVFTHKHDLTGISLLIGNYEKYTLTVDSIEIEWYSYKGNTYFSGWGKDSLQAEIYRRAKKRLDMNEYHYRRKYPFNRVIIAETPASFKSYMRSFLGYDDHTQPELLFFPEKSATVRYRRYTYEDIEKSKNIVSFFPDYDGEHPVTPLYRDYTGFISSDSFPGINMILMNMTRPPYPTGNSFFKKNNIDFFTDYSFGQLVKMTNLPNRTGFYYPKAAELRAYLTIDHSWEKLAGFIQDFYSGILFREADFREFNTAFAAAFNNDSLPQLLNRFYHKKGVPVFRVDGVEFNEVAGEEEKEYILSFYVWNQGDVDGIITTLVMQWEKYDATQSYIIKKGECRRIVASYEKRTTRLKVSTHISGNHPGYLAFAIDKPGITDSPLQPGIYPADTAVFTRKDEIVIDNDDPGFRLIDNSKKRKWFPKRLGEKNIHQKLGANQWLKIYSTEAFGHPVKTYYCKLAGKGEHAAEWTTTISKPGIYKVWANFPNDYMDGRWYGGTIPDPPGARLNYTIYFGNESIPVTIPLENGEKAGWKFLGEYRLPEGEAKVNLSDTGDDNITMTYSLPSVGPVYYTVHQLIMADAVKWKYIGE